MCAYKIWQETLTSGAKLVVLISMIILHREEADLGCLVLRYRTVCKGRPVRVNAEWGVTANFV